MRGNETNETSGQDDGQSPCHISYDKLSRRDIRSLIFHLLYAMEAFDYEISLEVLIDNFNRGFDLDIPGDSEVFKITQLVIDARDVLDAKIKPRLINWRFERIGLCTKLVLRQALWELINTDITPSIIINEAIEISKCFSEADAYKFINGILDEIAKGLDKSDESRAKKEEVEVDK